MQWQRWQLAPRYAQGVTSRPLAGWPSSAARRPNVILIVLDATRAANLSLYGYERPTTPRLERFAEGAIVYERAIATSCWSLPCHASIFTGLYPSAHGADDQHQFLDQRHPTMAGILADAGYQTIGLCEKRDVGPTTGADRGFQRFDQRHGSRSGLLTRRLENGFGRLTGTRDAGLARTSRKMRALLPKLAASEEPFFLFVSTVESHIPYRPPRRYDMFRPPGVTRRQAGRVNQDRWAYMSGRVPMEPEDFETLRALYDAGIRYADAALGRWFEWLEALRLLDDTMVIVTADHGENLGEHGLMAHGYCLYDTVIRVPLIIRYPADVAAPGRVTHQVQGVDLLPTVLSLAGVEAPSGVGLAGHDLLSSTRHDYTVAEQARPDMATFRRRFPEADLRAHDRELRMIRTDDAKFIWSSDGRHELYDLLADPGETRDVAGERPDQVAEMARRLEDWVASRAPAQAPPVTSQALDRPDVVPDR